MTASIVVILICMVVIVLTLPTIDLMNRVICKVPQRGRNCGLDPS